MKISVIFGTRPEAIKLAPVILKMKEYKDIECRVCVTAQHRQMLDQVLTLFKITPHIDLNIMKPNQTLAEITIRAMKKINNYLITDKPNLVLVQGDTTTTFIASLAAFYHKIPIAHIEAGLRSGNLKSPWPEEANRILTSRLTTFHFAPTQRNKENLVSEGIPEDKIYVTGNTIIDSLFYVLSQIKKNPFLIDKNIYSLFLKWGESPVVLITGHRRENFGKGIESICTAIINLAQYFKDVQFAFILHLNPNVRLAVKKIINNKIKKYLNLKNIYIIDHLPYSSFVALMNRAKIILTDSGGIQEEAPSLGKPVLVLRDTTERPEAIEVGTAKLVGTCHEKIFSETKKLLIDENEYDKMALVHNPYGDGNAAQRILKILRNYPKYL